MRRLMLLVAGLALLAGFAATVSGGGTQAEARWVITDLGTLGGKSSEAVGLNDRGQVVGWSKTKKGSRRAFLWQNGRMRDLGTFGGPGSMAFDINDRGQVVGWADTKARDKDGLAIRHAFLWQKGRMRDLGTFGGDDSWAAAVNDRGQVVGWAEAENGDEHVFLWQNGRLRDLGSLGGWYQGDELAMNDRGQIVGGSGIRDRTHAFLWQKGKMRDLGTFGGNDSWAADINGHGQIAVNNSYDWPGDEPGDAFVWHEGKAVRLRAFPGADSTAGASINGAGHVVGESSAVTAAENEDAAVHALLWRNGGLRDLGCRGDESCGAVAINDRDQVIGWSGRDGWNPLHAWVWQEETMTALGTLGGAKSGAVAINERGQIVGWSTNRHGKRHAVLWTLKRG